MRGSTPMTAEADRGSIRVSSLTKTYPGPASGLKVLDDVSVVAERGSYIALRGVSGSGKSTLLNILGASRCSTQARSRWTGPTWEP